MTWNNINSKAVKLDMEFLSDLSTSACVAKKKFKEILLGAQSSGNNEHWEKHNLNFS